MASPSLVDQSQPSDSISDDDPVTRTYTDVHISVYAAAIHGAIIGVFKERRHDLINFLTPNRNTLLHLHITASPAIHDTGFVEDILELCPALLSQANAKGETPLHLAARFGHARVVKLLVERAKAGRAGDLEISGTGEAAKQQMLRATNVERDTALHEAVRFRRLAIVQLLTKEDPEFSYPANKVGETPLYIAAERNYSQLVSEILDNCTSPAAGGPCGRTALHAATIVKNEGMYTQTCTYSLCIEKFYGEV